VIRMGLLVDELVPESRTGARLRPRAAARAAPPKKGTRR
jgi:hypothetical protein